jgi:hypothetical protein
MNDNEKTKLEAYADGQSMPKRRSPRRTKSTKAASVPKKTVTTPKVPPPEPIKLLETHEKATANIEDTHNIIFKPNPGPQTEFLAAGEREVLYGGSAGGGKSYAMLADPLRFMGHPSFSGLLLRHTTGRITGTYLQITGDVP